MDGCDGKVRGEKGERWRNKERGEKGDDQLGEEERREMREERRRGTAGSPFDP